MFNMEQYPLFTVIIPQKNRAEYLSHTIRTCMLQDYPNFEVIISDDCSEDNSVEVAEDLAKRDSRIKVFAHKEHLGMRDNFEFALNQVRPGYVMALGGDDGLVPGAIWKMYKLLKETGRELLTWKYAEFLYPRTSDSSKNMLIVTRNHQKPEIIKSKDFLSGINDSMYYLVDKCPMFYIKGVASTMLVDRVKSRTSDGCFYYCPTPDGFSGVVLAGEVEDFVFTYEPLSMGGNTTKSQGQNYARADKKSRFESEQFFNDNANRHMHKELASQPYSPLITLMTADYLLTAQDLPGWPGKDYYRVSFENVITKSFWFISISRYDASVLTRELQILKRIAEQHGLIELYEKLYKSTKIKVMKKPDIYGLTLSYSLRIEGSSVGINNIFDAANATPLMYNFVTNIKFYHIKELIINSIKNYLNSKKVDYIDLPKD